MAKSRQSDLEGPNQQPRHVHLRLSGSLHGADLETPHPVPLVLGGEHEIAVSFRRTTDAEVAEAKALGIRCIGQVTPVVVASGKWPCGKGTAAALEKVISNRIEDLDEHFVDTGVDGIQTTAVWEKWPPAVRDLVADAYPKLALACWRLVRFVRWRYGHHNLESPSGAGLEWSSDGATWLSLPTPPEPGGVQLEFAPIVRLGEGTELDVRTHLQKGIEEPLCHELWREAWGNRFRSPRSSLVVGVSAAEIGFKEFVARRLPAASWLAFHSPSPPLLKMLTDFLPDLLARLGVKPELLVDVNREKGAYRDSVLEQLNKAVEVRNRLMHKPDGSPDAEFASTCLVAIRDLLYLLDYYSGGRPWAVDHVRLDIREQWKAVASQTTASSAR